MLLILNATVIAFFNVVGKRFQANGFNGCFIFSRYTKERQLSALSKQKGEKFDLYQEEMTFALWLWMCSFVLGVIFSF